ncbi:hypothetical protein L5515_018859 [Caenorhabditis briggsae]|uniref:Uncharacterized protein n=1 Tax=Caenorhabditis briggsae TaxID=6238 RepID=A0AAE9FHX9_CAEBR|nr:hypothetical protein L5515_018859 [Caenorhabditis briggsae]
MYSQKNGSFEPTLNSLTSSLFYDADDEMLKEENILDLSGPSSSLEDDERLYKEEPQLDILQLFDQYNNDPEVLYRRSDLYKLDLRFEEYYNLQFTASEYGVSAQAMDLEDHYKQEEFENGEGEESDTETETETEESDTSIEEESDESEDDSDDEEDSIVKLTDMEYGEESDIEMMTEDEDVDSDQDELSDKDSGFEEVSAMNTSDDDDSDSD